MGRLRTRILAFLALALLSSSAQILAQGQSPEFEALKDLFGKEEAELTAESQEALKNLGAKFEQRLDAIIAELTAAGELEAAAAASETKQHIGEPLAVADKASESLITAQAIYDKAAAKLQADHGLRLLKLRTAYTKKLRALAVEHHEDTRIGAAIRREIDRFIAVPGNAFRDGGGTNEAQISKALGWLGKAQNADGSWGESYPAAMTGFALLAFAGHGETIDSPAHGAAIEKGIDYLIAYAKNRNGGLGKPGNASSYEHAIATYALAECYRLNQHHEELAGKLGQTLAKAVKLIIDGQTAGGGWLYAYRDNGVGDLSVSSWNIQAIKAAALAGKPTRELDACMQSALRYLERASRDTGLYRYRISDQHEGRVSLTGAGVLCTRILGEPRDNEDRSFRAILAKKPRQFRAVDLYAAYYHAQACFHKGGDTWKDFEAAYLPLIISSQEPGGDWPIAAGHLGAAAVDAKLYHTCLCTLILETSYRAPRWKGLAG